jgi:hypothetical protein
MSLSDIFGALSDKKTPSYQTFGRFGRFGGKILQRRFVVTQETETACDFYRKPF